MEELAALALTEGLVPLAARAAAAVDVAGGVFIYSRIFFSSLRARGLTFGALGEAAMLSRLPLGGEKVAGAVSIRKERFEAAGALDGGSRYG